MEPNLEEIKTKITAQTRSHYSVKTFQFVARDGYVEENGIKLQDIWGVRRSLVCYYLL